MSELIRKLEVYQLSGISNNAITELYNHLNDIFSNFVISTQTDGVLLYSKGDGKYMLQDKQSNILWIDYDLIWNSFVVKYRLYSTQIQDIITYIMFKNYNIKDHSVKLLSTQSVVFVMSKYTIKNS